MNDAPALVAASLAGLLLGAIFFGGLWWTVRKGMMSARPALWFFGSLLLRASLVMVGFHFVGQGDWRRLAACLVGFVIARILITRFPALPAMSKASTGEVFHEP
jgi:F1F0 ATPase subunit 2